MTRAALAVAALTLLIGLAASRDARGQDFAGPLPVGPAASALPLLEDGLPSATLSAHVTASATRWLGIEGLETRAVAGGLAMGRLRAAAGVSRTGPPDLGWAGAGLACGVAAREGGAAIRCVARRDRGPGAPGPPAAVGGEIGGGAWVEATSGVILWVRAPQMWTRGAAPPLARGMAVGGRWSGDGAALWFERIAPARITDDAGRHLIGGSLDLGPAAAWIEARDGPLRGGVGLGVRLRALALAARVDAHPVLGDTVLLSVTLGRRGARP